MAKNFSHSAFKKRIRSIESPQNHYQNENWYWSDLNAWLPLWLRNMAYGKRQSFFILIDVPRALQAIKPRIIHLHHKVSTLVKLYSALWLAHMSNQRLDRSNRRRFWTYRRHKDLDLQSVEKGMTSIAFTHDIGWRELKTL